MAGPKIAKKQWTPQIAARVPVVVSGTFRRAASPRTASTAGARTSRLAPRSVRRLWPGVCAMQLTEIRINLCGNPASSFSRPPRGATGANGGGGGGGGQGGRLRAFCSLTFDDTFVIRDVKLIDGND